ncbi:hypothetical protein H9635_02045 [Solibacillus sp. A46]|uniref:DUF4367 domain-containing protein n=1 Tax=Solibacillus faecavium TaxID=2762221 RepID=A0ABR8XU93_9BACL|nr:hypothetical protein [Solibacillus faecavium]MBD8035503.1 hypothetical protein [Solibacillus faecavium]
MDNYTPKEIKDLKVMKQRVIQNVVQEIENKRTKPKYRWRFIMISAIFTLCMMFFMLNQIMSDNQHSANTPQFDFTQPQFYEEHGLFYLNGFTLGDLKSDIVERLGEKNLTEIRVAELIADSELTEIQEDGNGADFILNYKGEARFYFYDEKLFSMLLLNTNEEQFEKIYKAYNGMKFTAYGQHYLYSSETSQIIKAEITPMGNLYLYLSIAELEQLRENEGYIKLMESTN